MGNKLTVVAFLDYKASSSKKIFKHELLSNLIYFNRKKPGWSCTDFWQRKFNFQIKDLVIFEASVPWTHDKYQKSIAQSQNMDQNNPFVK